MAKVADPASIVPTANPDAVSPHSEAFQAVIRHLLGIHPRFSRLPRSTEKAKSESVALTRPVF